MKKRTISLLLALCALLLLPTAALAAETETVSPWKVSTDNQGSQCYAAVCSWDDLEKALQTVPDVTNISQSALTIDVSGFAWPESTDGETIELVLDYPRTSQKSDTPYQMPRICLYGKADDSGFATWEIPAHIALTCYEDMERDYYSAPVRIAVNGALSLAGEIRDDQKKSEILVNGALSCMPDAGGWEGADLRTFASVTVNSGGVLAAEYTEFPQAVILNAGASMEMGRTNYVFDLTVHSGATFTSTSERTWYLFGTLALDDGMELDVGALSLWTSSSKHSGPVNAAIATDGAAAVKGTISLEAFHATAALALRGDLALEMLRARTSDSGTAQIIVPADSHVELSSANASSADNGLDMHVTGTLELGAMCNIRSWKSGELVLGETAEDGTVTAGTVILRPSSRLFAEYLNRDGTVNEAVTGKITGNGTIRLYAQLYPNLDSYDWGAYPWLFGRSAYAGDNTAPLYEKGYIADTVTLWRNWDPQDNPCQHSWDEGIVTTAATCTEAGERLCTCSQCETTRVEIIAATGHAQENNEAVAPTCTDAGLTAGTSCSVCHEALSGRETVAALGHDWSPGSCDQAASCTRCGAKREAGEHHYAFAGTCTVCGEGGPVSFQEATAAVTLDSLPEGATGAWIAAYRDGQLLAVIAGQQGSNQLPDAARQADELRVFYPDAELCPVAGAHRLYS